MNFSEALSVYQQLNSRRTASTDPRVRLQMRLAARWVKRAMVSPTTVGINEMCYAQVLNGALALAPAFAPMSNPLAAYRTAKMKAQSGKKDGKWENLSDEWFNPESQNLYLPVYKSVRAASGLTNEEKEDLLMRVLMGIGTAMRETTEGAGDWAQTLREGPAFWLAGEALKSKIKSGASLPTTFGSGGAITYVVVIAKNAAMDIFRNKQRSQTRGVERDEEYGGTQFSADIGRQEDDAPENVAETILSNPELLERLFNTALPKSGGQARVALINEARVFWNSLTALTAVRRAKDPTRGKGLILAYLELVEGGVTDPKFPAIASLAMKKSTPEETQFRTDTPLKGNDWTETKEIAFGAMSKMWSKNREVKDLLAKYLEESREG